MRDWQGQSHVKWYSTYHVVSVPKYRRLAMFVSLRRHIGRTLRNSCAQQGVEIVEGRAMWGHIHLCLGIPPKVQRGIYSWVSEREW